MSHFAPERHNMPRGYKLFGLTKFFFCNALTQTIYTKYICAQLLPKKLRADIELYIVCIEWMYSFLGKILISQAPFWKCGKLLEFTRDFREPPLKRVFHLISRNYFCVIISQFRQNFNLKPFYSYTFFCESIQAIILSTISDYIFVKFVCVCLITLQT